MHTITFDFWDTLYREPPGRTEAREHARLCAVRGWIRHRRPGTTEAEAGAAWREVCDRATAVWVAEQITPSAAWRVEAVAKHLDVPCSAACVCELVAALEGAAEAHPPVMASDARQTLGRLRAQGSKIGLISDTGQTPARVLRDLLRADGLIDSFDTLVFSDEAGRSKPAAAVFEGALRALGGADPASAAHVGNSWRTDVSGAVGVGMWALHLLTTEAARPGPDRYRAVSCLSEVADFAGAP